MTENELLNTTDARVWAKEFMLLFGETKENIDEGLMIAWFANAIETGRSAGEHFAMVMSDSKDQLDGLLRGTDR